MPYYSDNELISLGFKYLGRGIRISSKASFYGTPNIEIGDFSRIDDFCVLSAGEGGICIGRHVHVAAYTSLIGLSRIELHDYANLSSRVGIYSSNDDYSGDFMTNPTIPAELTRVTHAPVVVGRHVIIGSGSIILPSVTLHECSGVGALSLIHNDCEAFGMYAGVPASLIGQRSRGLLEMEQKLIKMEQS